MILYSDGRQFRKIFGKSGTMDRSHTNDHLLTDTLNDEKWLVLVGRPSLAASRWRARRPAPLKSVGCVKRARPIHRLIADR